MKTCNILVNDKKYTIEFEYEEENDKLIIGVRNFKGNLVGKRLNDIITEEFFKGFKVEKEQLALRQCKKQNWPITLYTDTDGEINGALFYKNNDFQTEEDLRLNIPRLKIASFLNKGYTFITCLILSFLIITVCQDKIKELEYNKQVQAYYQVIQENYNSDYLIKLLLNNNNLSEEMKLFFTNEIFFNDLVNTNINPSDQAAIFYSLHNFKITEYDTARKIMYDIKEHTNPTENPYGYVSTKPYRKDEINVYKCNDNLDKKVILHEFMHLLQKDSEYFYLTESLAEILAFEYWDYPINTYHNSIKRIYTLMEIIGKDAVWDAFFGTSEQLESEISKYLTEEETQMFLECLRQRPYNNTYDQETGVSEIDIELDRLLGKMYQNKYESNITDNVKIQSIYNLTAQGLLQFSLGDVTYMVPTYYFNSTKQNEEFFCSLTGETLTYKIKK